MTKFNQHRVLPGSVRTTLFGEDAGAVDDNQEIDVTLHLRRRKQLDALAVTVSKTFLTRQELEAEYGASPDDVKTVLAFAQHFGLQAIDVDAGKRIVCLRGTAQALSSAFRVQLLLRNQSGKFLRARLGPILVPLELVGVVTGVFGLDNRPQAKPHLRISQSHLASISKPSGFDGNQLAGIYDFPAGDGKGETIALIELGGGYISADIAAFFMALNLPEPTVKSVSVNGANNSPIIDAGADTEVALDIEVLGAAAPASTIVVYFAPNDDQSFLQAILTAVHDATNKPSIISISWGAAESAWTPQQMTAMDEAFQSAAAVGISVFCAAGDDGCNDNVNDGKVHVDFPASSPFVTACGGTTLVVSNGARQESVWNDGDGSATGGGISGFFAVPAYQNDIVMPANLASSFQGRGLPDLSAVADPNTGYAVLVDGLWQLVGGTSAVSPLVAALLARINAIAGRPSGLINPALYRASVNNQFNDIISGNNSVDGVNGYSASAGWDPVSGWGTPGGSSLLRLLSASTPTSK